MLQRAADWHGVPSCRESTRETAVAALLAEAGDSVTELCRVQHADAVRHSGYAQLDVPGVLQAKLCVEAGGCQSEACLQQAAF